MATVAELQQQINTYEKLVAGTPPASPQYKAYVQLLNTLKAQLAQAQSTVAPAPIPVAPPTEQATFLSRARASTPPPTPYTGANPAVNAVVSDQRANVATQPRTSNQSDPPLTPNTYWQNASPTMTKNTPTPVNTSIASPTTQSGYPANSSLLLPSGPVNKARSGYATSPSQLTGLTQVPTPATSDEEDAVTTTTENQMIHLDGIGWGYWYMDAYGERQFNLVSADPGSSAIANETESEAAVNTAQAAYYEALAQGQGESAAQSAAQLAFDQAKWQEQLAWEKESAASSQAAQQQQWAEQLAWYKQQADMEAQQEAARVASERQSYLSDLAANPRSWIKYNLETTNEAGATPSWLSKLYEGKVEAGAPLDTAKAQGNFPILSKNWYNWLNPSERDMMSGYLSWAGTSPEDYWSNLWWARGNQPKGAPRMVPVSQK